MPACRRSIQKTKRRRIWSTRRAVSAVAARRAALAKLGTRLRRLRNDAALTQEAVAETIGVSTQTVRNWEMGRNEPSDDAVR